MNRATKKILSFALAAALLLGAGVSGPLAVTAQAADAEIQAGLPGTITLGTASDNPTVIGFAGYEWIVIGYNGEGVHSSAGDTDSVTLLLKSNSANITGWGWTSYFRENTNINYTTNPNEYSGSTLQSAIQGIWNGFPDKERALINPRDLTDITPRIENQLLWPLSVAEADKDKIARIDTPQIGAAPHHLMGNPVLFQKWRPGCFNGDGRGHHEYIIGLPVSQPVHPLRRAGNGFPGALGPLEIGIPLLQSEIGVEELPVTQLDRVLAPFIPQLPLLQPSGDLRVRLHIHIRENLVPVFPLLFFHQLAVTTTLHHVPGFAKGYNLSDALHIHFQVAFGGHRLHFFGVRLVVDAVVVHHQLYLINLDLVLPAQNAGNFLQYIFVLQLFLLPLLPAHVLGLLLRVVFVKQRPALVVFMFSTRMDADLIENLFLFPFDFDSLLRGATIALNLDFGVLHSIPSTPAVLLPLLLDTRFTARALA